MGRDTVLQKVFSQTEYNRRRCAGNKNVKGLLSLINSLRARGRKSAPLFKQAVIPPSYQSFQLLHAVELEERKTDNTLLYDKVWTTTVHNAPTRALVGLDRVEYG